MSAERTSDVRRSRAARIAGLYVVTPDVDATGVLVAKVVAALEGGASVVQYRNKTAAEAARRVQAQALASVHARRPRSPPALSRRARRCRRGRA
jgi:hypothetical protein